MPWPIYSETLGIEIMEKKYCKNCKFKNGLTGCVRKPPSVNKYTGHILCNDRKANQFGECSYYSRQWWKIWAAK